jgi:hypothetical protein
VPARRITRPVRSAAGVPTYASTGSRRRRLRPVPIAAAAAVVAAALVGVVVGPALAERPGEGRGQVGKNWTSTVQDAQPSGKQPSRQSRDAQLPADARSRAPMGVQPGVPAGSEPYQP